MKKFRILLLLLMVVVFVSNRTLRWEKVYSKDSVVFRIDTWANQGWMVICRPDGIGEKAISPGYNEGWGEGDQEARKLAWRERHRIDAIVIFIILIASLLFILSFVIPFLYNVLCKTYASLRRTMNK